MALHPRTAIRHEVAAAAQEVLPDGVNAYAGRTSELGKSEVEAVLVNTESDISTRPPGDGEERSKRPLIRSVEIDIQILTRVAGDGSQSADRADELARDVSLMMNDRFPTMNLLSEEMNSHIADPAKRQVKMTYIYEYFDEMEGTSS